MSKLKQRISVFVFAASVFGLLLSMMHYHSVKLDCLEHAGESHYTEYVLACPVCALTVQIDADHIHEFNAFIQFQEFVVTSQEKISLQESYDSPLGRSPPLSS